MGAPTKQHAIRRSTRLPLEVPVLVTSLDAALNLSEECSTTLVNAHGCGLITQRPLPRDLPVRIEIIPAKRHTTARVADVVSLGGIPETWLLGLELDHPGNFWGIEYAPADWKAEESPAPPSNLEPERSVPAVRCSAAQRWRLTDISVGACYLEAVEPLPVGTPVLMSVRVANSECLLDGVVRASHPQSGMGVEFVSPAQDHRARVEELIGRLVKHREVPRVFVGRKERAKQAQLQLDTAPPEPPDTESPDPLLELIRKGDSLPLQEFLDDLKAQRLGERPEARIEVSLPVELSGTDINGSSFAETARTSNVSHRGAQLEGVQARLRPGDTVSIAYANRKEDFRVAWVGASLTPLAGQIGVVVIEQSTSLWDPAPATNTAESSSEVTSVRRRSPIPGPKA
jgi:PilZ domain